MQYDYSEIVEYLLHWYDYNHRILRWRLEPKPYYIWVSEIMLQQTRVEAVKDYFDRFLEALPDVKDLAAASEETLLKLWEGLGYYNRVRNMQKAARIMVEQYGGKVPGSYKELIQLPGIGSYTAGAIASTGFGEKVPAVDGNVLRVAKRLAGSYDDITKASVKKQLEEDLKEVMPERPGDFNQSLMELGALICIPNGKPLCDQCPVMHLCRAFQQEIQMEIPVKPAKKTRRKEEKTVLILQKGDQVALMKRDREGLLAGLWELPSLPGRQSETQIETWLTERGMQAEEIRGLKQAKHIFSHVEWHMTGYYIRLKELPQSSLEEGRDTAWPGRREREEGYALPSAFDSFRVYLEQGEETE